MPTSDPHLAEGPKARFLSGEPIRYYRPQGNPAVRDLVDRGFQAFNAARLSEACHIFTGKMLDPRPIRAIGLTLPALHPGRLALPYRATKRGLVLP